MSHYSWLTQRIINRVPLWSDARSLPFSVAQQLINPMASEIEDLYKYVSDGNRNKFLTTANLDLMDVIYTVRLPNDFEFGTYGENLQSPLYVAPQVYTEIDGLTIWIEPTTTIEDFWYDALPTRAVHGSSERIVPVREVLEETVLEDLSSATLNAIALPTRLVVTVADCETFVDLSRRTDASFLMLTGVTERGLTETELLLIPYNGVFLTKKIWKSLTSVEYYGLQPEDTGNIQIDCFAFNKGREVDKYQLYVTSTTEKLLYHRFTTHDFAEGTYAIHQQMTVTADTLGDLYNGVDTLESVREIELLYNGENLVLHDMAIQPFTGRIFALSDDAIYIFDQYGNLPDCRGLGAKTPGASMVINVDKYDYLRGETATITPYWRKPSKRVYRNRWSIQKPDGTVSYIDIDGTEGSDGSTAWIHNQTYADLVFGPFESDSGNIDKQSFTYTLSQRGTYLVILETVFTDNSVEKDIIPLHVHYKEALKKLRLPPQLVGGDGIAFDADQKLWILRRAGEGNYYDLSYEYSLQYEVTGCAWEVRLATDTMMVDFENKILYLHEDYDSVIVSESQDWTVEQ